MRALILSSFLFLTLLLAPPAIAADACRWESDVLPADRDRVLPDVRQLAARVPSSERMPDSLGDDLKRDSAHALQLARDLLARARAARPVGGIVGTWRVRSMQVGRDSAFDYPFFQARIERRDCGLAFGKTSGSQRRSGLLYPVPGDATRMAFLGSATVNDNPTAPYGAGNPPLGTANGSAGDAAVNSVGQLLRIGTNELLMILDAGEDGFELYHLKR